MRTSIFIYLLAAGAAASASAAGVPAPQCSENGSEACINDEVALLQSKRATVQRRVPRSADGSSVVAVSKKEREDGSIRRHEEICKYMAPNNDCESEALSMLLPSSASVSASWDNVCNQYGFYTPTGEKQRCFGKYSHDGCRPASAMFGRTTNCETKVFVVPPASQGEFQFHPSADLRAVPGSKTIPLGIINTKCGVRGLWRAQQFEPAPGAWASGDPRVMVNTLPVNEYKRAWQQDRAPAHVLCGDLGLEGAVDNLEATLGNIASLIKKQTDFTYDERKAQIIQEHDEKLAKAKMKYENAANEDKEEEWQDLQRKFMNRGILSKKEQEELDEPLGDLQELERTLGIQIDVKRTMLTDLQQFADDDMSGNYRWNQWADICGMTVHA